MFLIKNRSKILITPILILLMQSSLATQTEDGFIDFDVKERVIENKFQLPDPFSKQEDTNRWYTNEQVKNGKEKFSKTCTACHGQNAAGITEDWQQPLENGGYPPPPLNGSAHGWHHPLWQLHEVIKGGLLEYGVSMPPWKEVYSDEEILELIASFQSYWSDSIYKNWLKRN